MFPIFLDSFAFALASLRSHPRKSRLRYSAIFSKKTPSLPFFPKSCADLLVDLKRLRSSSLLVPRRSSVVATAPPQILVWSFLGLKRATPARKGPAEPDFRQKDQSQNLPLYKFYFFTRAH